MTSTLAAMKAEHALGIAGHESDCPKCQDGEWPTGVEASYGFRVYRTTGRVPVWRWEILKDGVLYTYTGLTIDQRHVTKNPHGHALTRSGAETAGRRKALRLARKVERKTAREQAKNAATAYQVRVVPLSDPAPRLELERSADENED